MQLESDITFWTGTCSRDRCAHDWFSLPRTRPCTNRGSPDGPGVLGGHQVRRLGRGRTHGESYSCRPKRAAWSCSRRQPTMNSRAVGPPLLTM